MARRRRSDTIFLNRLLDSLVINAENRAQNRLRPVSKTLSANLRVIKRRKPPLTRDLWIPHYWALMVNDGRRAFGRGRLLIWFEPVEDDPRFEGSQTPPRMREVRRLTSNDDLSGKKIIKTKNGVRGVAPTKFFDNDPGGAMFGLRADADDLVDRRFSTLIQKTVPGVRKERRRTAKTRIRFR